MHLELNGQKYPISRDRNQKRTTYSRVFDPPLTLDSALYFSTIPKKSLFTRTRKSDLEIITFAPDHIRTRLNGLGEHRHKYQSFGPLNLHRVSARMGKNTDQDQLPTPNSARRYASECRPVSARKTRGSAANHRAVQHYSSQSGP
ncbi:hypothetical protein PISMIDRAFT_601452 [Pisolithus microcarpus 441]|uniref:Uncharacterized protein n=1 Tax=Pisolithus microcarpus 441 TaxID=765257 RepID=A0A0C9YTR4_9AGAM|nr:hypothetical protein PISMIDRAFT_601452 [Pisolithus microcarpus 441]